jgi:hypothetical protein
MDKIERCSVPGCKNESGLVYYGHPICFRCWVANADGKIDLKKKLNIKEGKGK